MKVLTAVRGKEYPAARDVLLVSTSTTNSLVNLIDNSSSLFHLHYLQELSLAYSFYGSSIPPAFGNLTNLSYLNLSNAGFEISHLTIYFI